MGRLRIFNRYISHKQLPTLELSETKKPLRRGAFAIERKN